MKKVLILCATLAAVGFFAAAAPASAAPGKAGGVANTETLDLSAYRYHRHYYYRPYRHYYYRPYYYRPYPYYYGPSYYQYGYYPYYYRRPGIYFGFGW